MSQIELENIRLACKTKREKAIVEVLYSTGCRVTELERINVPDVNFETKEIVLLGKGDKNRISYLNAKAEVSLKDYLMLTQQLENKLSRYGIEMVKISEAYTSQTCPHCGEKHKPTNRNYKCKCGYTQHRDLVGAMNMLNFQEKKLHIERYKNLKYLRID